MSHQSLEDARHLADVDDDSDADMGSGHVNEHNESASFLEAFKYSHAAYEDQQIAENQVKRGRRFRVLSVLLALGPWLVSLILLIALLSERLQSKYLCNGDVKAQYSLAQDYIEYRTELMYDGVDNRNPMSEYQGWPNDDRDKLWDQFDGGEADLP